jgi:hypothetical protein
MSILNRVVPVHNVFKSPNPAAIGTLLFKNFQPKKQLSDDNIYAGKIRCISHINLDIVNMIFHRIGGVLTSNLSGKILLDNRKGQTRCGTG